MSEQGKRTRKTVDFKTRCCLLYEFKNEVSAVDASRKICRAFGAGTISPEAASYWYKKFKAGNENIDETRSAGATDAANDSSAGTSTAEVKPKKPRAPRKKKSDEVANQQAESSGLTAPKQAKLESIVDFATEASKPKTKKPRKKKSDQQPVPMEAVQPQVQSMVPMQVQKFEATPFVQLQPLTPMQQFTHEQQPLMAPVQESEHTIKVEMSECGYLQPKLEAMAEANKENSQTEDEWADADQEPTVEAVNVEDEW
ncbi:Histone-lysine N-methyltransferase SETMAR-like [Aphelenchoides besseyi]|nr:Histone-lysine N-methyltransferase SETMAR-like [Aphelenchoides besseyi]KAI6193104.1 Histone-lysine N-methyltransferase SETMAR-like [Aphelenchoides besseyi]